MLLLLFYVGDYRYALLGKRVIEVISLVELKKIAQAPQYVAGLLNYRSEIIPVIDLCQLLAGNPCRSQLSTRIIVVNYRSDEQTPYLLGLIAERVTDTLNVPENDVDSGTQLNTEPYLGNIIMNGQSIIQYIHVESILSESERRYLLPK
jgi:chemotaxis-related protein WspB